MSKAIDRSSQRMEPLDALRGIIMILMALDHASFFIARMHSREFWGTPLPDYTSVLPFIMRLASHICAPGFFFLMGVGMALMARARLGGGWSHRQLIRFFAVRGILLMTLQLLVENPAWGLAFVFGTPGSFISRGGPLPGSGEGLAVYFGVLFALGAVMLVWAFLMKLRWQLQLALVLGAILFTQWVIPGSDASPRLYHAFVRLLVIPGRTAHVVVFYPVIPWLGVAGLGVLLGRWLAETSNGKTPLTWAGWCGVLGLVVFALIRSIGGSGNLHPPAPGWIGFFNLTKYPPSVAFICLTMGVNCLLLWVLSMKGVAQGALFKTMAVYGRAPLFFYVVHLYLYGIMGWLVPAGVAPAPMMLFWLAGLVLLYPLCKRYDYYKHRRPIASLWRYF